jgi:hypothetical protein
VNYCQTGKIDQKDKDVQADFFHDPTVISVKNEGGQQDNPSVARPVFMIF